MSRASPIFHVISRIPECPPVSHTVHSSGVNDLLVCVNSEGAVTPGLCLEVHEQLIILIACAF